MNRGLLAIALAASLTTPLFLAGCDDDDCCDGEETNIIGRVTLAGMPVANAQVRAIFDFVIFDTEVSAADGTFFFPDWPEHFSPFAVEAFYVDPITLNEYFGNTPLILTNEDGVTDVGDIILVQVFPATAGNTVASGDFDGDSVEDLVASYPGALVLVLSSAESRILASAGLDEAPFGPLEAADIDGDRFRDLQVIRIGTRVKDVWKGDGTGGFTLVE
jgi:FG-GAP repeat